MVVSDNERYRVKKWIDSLIELNKKRHEIEDLDSVYRSCSQGSADTIQLHNCLEKVATLLGLEIEVTDRGEDYFRLCSRYNGYKLVELKNKCSDQTEC